MSDISKDPAATCFFRLKIDGQDFGEFNTCEGLGSTVEIHQYQEGGNNGFTWQLPSRVTFSNITMSRPVVPETAKVAEWISSVTTGVLRPTGVIEALRSDHSVVSTWALLEVIPVSWRGPSLNVEQNAASHEFLEIAHHGFKTTAGAA